MSARRASGRRAELVFALVVLAIAGALAACFGVLGTATNTRSPQVTALISRDGAVVQTIDPSNVEEPFTFLLEDARGSNLVEVDHGRIRVAEADCPDKVCEHTGWIERTGQVIACVPHGLTIVVAYEGEEAVDGPDAVAG